MFGRLKQKVKEKTGRAAATSLPEDVESSVTYFKSLNSRVKDLHKSLVDLNDVYKWQKKANFTASIDNLARLSNVKINMQPFEEAVKARISAEDESQRGLSAEVDKFKAYMQNDGKLQQESISLLNRHRLDMDAAAGNYASNETDANKIRAEAATKEFESSCQKMRDLYTSVNQLETDHSKWMEGITGQMKVAFRKASGGGGDAKSKVKSVRQ